MINKNKTFCVSQRWRWGYNKTIYARDDNLCRAFKKDSSQGSHPFAFDIC